MRTIATKPSLNATYWLLWLTALAAFVLCGVAFVLWGINGPVTLFDMMVALCF